MQIFGCIHLCQVINPLPEVETRMTNASKMIRDWSKSHGERSLPNHWHLTRARLSLKGATYCHLIGKGWHTTIVLQFLLDFVQTLPAFDPLLITCLWSCNNFLGLLQFSRCRSVLLAEDEVRQVVEIGNLYLRSYLKAHVKYRQYCTYLLFNLRPKWHLLSHFLQSCERIRNPLCSSTWMDESWIGAMMRLASKCHKKTVQNTALQRYCTGPCSSTLSSLTFTGALCLAGLKAELQAALAALQ